MFPFTELFTQPGDDQRLGFFRSASAFCAAVFLFLAGLERFVSVLFSDVRWKEVSFPVFFRARCAACVRNSFSIAFFSLLRLVEWRGRSFSLKRHAFPLHRGSLPPSFHTIQQVPVVRKLAPPQLAFSSFSLDGFEESWGLSVTSKRLYFFAALAPPPACAKGRPLRSPSFFHFLRRFSPRAFSTPFYLRAIPRFFYLVGEEERSSIFFLAALFRPKSCNVTASPASFLLDSTSSEKGRGSSCSGFSNSALRVAVLIFAFFPLSP